MKKKILSLLVLCFLAISLVFTGCKKPGLENNPDTGAATISNGGMTVVKGDYLYFVNGYVDETTLGNFDNKEGKVTKGAIYRTKLADGEISKDKDGFMAEDTTDLVVSKVVGFSNGGFYIIDDTIYYATPYMELSSDGVLQNDRVEFHRIDINGNKKTDKAFFVTDANVDNLNWTIYKVEDKTYLVTYCNSVLYSIDTATGETVAKIDKSESFALHYESNYSTDKVRTEEQYRYVYYTRAVNTETDSVSADLKGNFVCRFDVTNGNVEILNRLDNYKYTISKVMNNALYYTKTNAAYSSGNSYIYKQDLASAWNASATDLTNGVAYNNYYACPFGDYVIATTDSAAFVTAPGEGRVQVDSTPISVLEVFGGYAYYNNSGVLYRFKITDPANTKEMVGDDGKTHIYTNNHFIDFDNQRVYVYAEYTAENEDKNYYLNYIDETTLKERFVGIFEDGDMPVAPKQDDKYGEDPDVEYKPHID